MSEAKIEKSERLGLHRYSLGEELASSITHGAGALLAVWGMVMLILRGAQQHSGVMITSACLYGASMILLYTVSCLYHALTAPRAKKVFRVLDHCMVYLLILGTYIPVTLVMIGGWRGWTLFGLVTACTAVGATFTAIDMKRWKKLSMALYIVTGWMALLALGVVVRTMTAGQIACLIGGGLCYTGGILFYRRKDKKWMHAVWHAFVLAGTILHYFMVYGGYAA
ncbi:MAG: hemolysin III family protein [Eubacteriales bacterium]|nr:hemolysin III family protein [Eubacteriales bacterium]